MKIMGITECSKNALTKVNVTAAVSVKYLEGKSIHGIWQRQEILKGLELRERYEPVNIVGMAQL